MKCSYGFDHNSSDVHAVSYSGKTKQGWDTHGQIGWVCACGWYMKGEGYSSQARYDYGIDLEPIFERAIRRERKVYEETLTRWNTWLSNQSFWTRLFPPGGKKEEIEWEVRKEVGYDTLP